MGLLDPRSAPLYHEVFCLSADPQHALNWLRAVSIVDGSLIPVLSHFV